MLDLVVTTAIVLVTAVLGVTVFLLVPTSSRWGINSKPPSACPTCQSPLPWVRRPADAHEALWGGWTCKTCGSRLDRRGRLRENAA